MTKEEETKMLNDNYKIGYDKAEAFLDSAEFKNLLKHAMSDFKNPYQVQGFSDGVVDTIELTIKDVDHDLD